MSDAELAEWLGLTAAEAAVIIPKLTPEKRAMYERMQAKYVEVMLWQEGVAPFPDGVLIDGPRQIRMGKP